jgi:hypothetical protein
VVSFTEEDFIMTKVIVHEQTTLETSEKKSRFTLKVQALKTGKLQVSVATGKPKSSDSAICNDSLYGG